MSEEENRDSLMSKREIKILNNLPDKVIADIEDIENINGYKHDNPKLFLDSYISIVTETSFYIDNDFISEKIWKPIGHCQPFILAGPAHSLEYIKSIGYKTFHPYIDESYDNETEDFTRLNMIMAEVEKFTNKSKEEKDQFLKDIMEVCRHNQELFLSYSKQKFRIICDDIIIELRKKSTKLF
jgi:hypothetical protein